jgi:hypothetical protein
MKETAGRAAADAWLALVFTDIFGSGVIQAAFGMQAIFGMQAVFEI